MASARGPYGDHGDSMAVDSMQSLHLVTHNKYICQRKDFTIINVYFGSDVLCVWLRRCILICSLQTMAKVNIVTWYSIILKISAKYLTFVHHTCLQKVVVQNLQASGVQVLPSHAWWSRHEPADSGRQEPEGGRRTSYWTEMKQ